jgi:hypothetical protein
MLVHHRERSPGALAHGAAKSSDIQLVRRQLGAAELRTASRLEAAAVRHRDHATRTLDPGPARGPAPA